MRGITSIRLLILAASILALCCVAVADTIDITLTQSTLTGAAGTTVTFDATLTNTSSSTIFLNGDSFTTSSPFLTVDDNPFLTNFPLSLPADGSSGPFPLFSVLIAPGATAGSYGSNSFTILGGLTGSDFGSVGSTVFTVDVSPVPEPSTLVLLASGLFALGIRGRLRKT